MRYMGYIVWLLVVVILMLPGCMEDTAHMNESVDKEIERVSIKNFTTDKNTYGSHEEVDAIVRIESPREMQDVSARVYGIAPYDHPMMSNSKTIDLTAGENDIHVRVHTPHCTSGCGGVTPGAYQLSVTLTDGERGLDSADTTIELISD